MCSTHIHICALCDGIKVSFITSSRVYEFYNLQFSEMILLPNGLF